MKKKLNIFTGIGLLFLFSISINSLLGFPDAYDDEGFYAAQGKGYVETGHFASPSVRMEGPFDDGNAWNPRLHALLFGLVGKWASYRLGTARAVSFTLTWIAILFWTFFARRIGFSPMLGALLLAANERVFYSSHAFRPEAPMILGNVILLIFVAMPDSKSFARGLFNAPLILAHGTGLSSCILNAFEFATRILKKPGRALRMSLLFALGSLLAIFVFYLVQIRDVGGWQVASNQMELLKQYQVSASLFENVKRDLSLRWWLELVAVGNSNIARVLRWLFYSLCLGVSIRSVISFGDSSARKFGSLALGCAFAYALVVPDKIDLHIAEMVPFFLAALMSWFLAESKKHPLRAQAVLGAVLLSSLTLSAHHALAHSKPRLDSFVQIIDRRVATLREANPAEAIAMIGDLKYWFAFHDKVSYTGVRYIEKILPLHGRVIVLGSADKHEFFQGCAKKYQDGEGLFTEYLCP